MSSYIHAEFETCVPYDLDEKETDIIVSYEIDPGEAASRDCPGSAPSLEIYAIEPANKGESISDLAHNELLDEDGKYYARLVEDAWEHHTKNWYSAKDARDDARMQEWKDNRQCSAVAVDVFAEHREVAAI